MKSLSFALLIFTGVFSSAAGAQSYPNWGTGFERNGPSVNVYGRRNAMEANGMRLGENSSSDCHFTPGTGPYISEYLDHFVGRERLGDDSSDPWMRPRANPYGDARTGAFNQGGRFNGSHGLGCSAADARFAAGRMYILANDRTLHDARAALRAKDYPKALALLQKSWSKIGYDEAALTLGDLYLNGLGTERDVKQALAWYDKAANARLVNGHRVRYQASQPERANARVFAQLRLANLYMAGVDVPKDEKAARRWYEQASELDYIPARYSLARMMLNGYGGEQNVNKGIKLMTEAAEYGYAPAQWSLARSYDAGAVVPRDAVRAFAWYRQALLNPTPDRHKPYAQLAAARMLDKGDGIAASARHALAMYKAAAVAGHPEAQNALATYFYEGGQVKQDHKLARKLFITAASQGHPDAMSNAAVMLFKGEGGVADLVQAYVWLTLAAKQGHAGAPDMAALVEKRMSESERSKAELALEPVRKS